MTGRLLRVSSRELSTPRVAPPLKAQVSEEKGNPAQSRALRWPHLAMGHNLWLHFGVDEHPFAADFDVHQGHRVLTYSHLAT